MTYVIIGLGNPGETYAKTRHNAGRMAVETFGRVKNKNGEMGDFSFRKIAHATATQGSIQDQKVTLVLPEVSMNLSGKSTTPFVKSVKAAQKLLVIRDDLDLPMGTLKMTTYGRGSGGHKGIESIMRALKTKEFAQLKIGISPVTPKGTIKKLATEEKVVGHVIGAFSAKEELILKEIFKRTNNSIELFITQGIEAAMLYTNTA
jgi:peptidyl-tRNA hydrolase, PTH1 family